MIFGTQSIEQRNILRFRYDQVINGLSVEQLSQEIFEWQQDWQRCNSSEVDTRFFIDDRIQAILEAMKFAGCEKPDEDKNYKRYLACKRDPFNS